MNRLIENTVFSGLVTDWRFATWPTRRSSFEKPTTDGVVRAPSWLTTTAGSPASITATTELVVPRSIPMTLLIAVQLHGSSVFSGSEDHISKQLVSVKHIFLVNYTHIIVV